MDKIAKEDWQYVEQNPEGDADFSEERNKSVIAGVLKKYEKMRRVKRREFEEDSRERGEAAAHYLKALESGASTAATKYFGRKELARLRGEEVLNKLKASPELLAKLKEKFN